MEKKVLQAVGNRIRDLRKQKGLSQEELGELAGFHFSYIGGVERAEKNISLLNLQKITNALDQPFYELFLYGKHLKLEKTDKDILLNSINEQLMVLKASDLKKVQMLLTQFFQDK